MFDHEYDGAPAGAAARGGAVLVIDPAEIAALEARVAWAEMPSEDEVLPAEVAVPAPWDEAGFDAWIDELAASDPSAPRAPADVVTEAEHAPVTGELIAQLATVDPSGLDPSARVGWMVAWSRVENYAAARKLAAIHTVAGPAPEETDLRGVGDYGFAEVGAALRLGDGESGALTHAARDLATRLPATFAAMCRGDLTWRKARAIVDRTTGLTPEQCAEVEQAVLAKAVARVPARHDAAVRRAVDRLDPDAAAARRRQRQRDITLVRAHVGDGMAELLARLRSEDAEVIWTGADAWARRASAGGDPRPLDELRVVALVRWAESFLTHGDPRVCDQECAPAGPPTAAGGAAGAGGTTSTAARGGPGGGEPVAPHPGPPRRHGRPITVNLTLDLPTFLGLTDTPGELLGTGTLIPAESIRDLVPDAAIRRLITHPLTGHLLDATPHTARPTAALAGFVALRDVEPTTPTAGPSRSGTGAGAGDHDHITPRSAGGVTTRDNLHSPTRRWHRAKTLAGWTVTTNPDHTWTWTSPAGRSYTTHPHDYRLGP